MHFDVAGINHQPLIVRLVNERFQQSFPGAIVTPAAKAPMGVFPATIVGRQIAPGRACAQYPEDSVKKASIIVGNATPGALAPRKAWLKQLPGVFVNVVAVMPLRGLRYSGGR
jgi:hypothetical protein